MTAVIAEIKPDPLNPIHRSALQKVLTLREQVTQLTRLQETDEERLGELESGMADHGDAEAELLRALAYADGADAQSKASNDLDVFRAKNYTQSEKAEELESVMEARSKEIRGLRNDLAYAQRDLEAARRGHWITRWNAENERLGKQLIDAYYKYFNLWRLSGLCGVSNGLTGDGVRLLWHPRVNGAEMNEHFQTLKSELSDLEGTDE